jgi:hypothetical protein
LEKSIALPLTSLSHLCYLDALSRGANVTLLRYRRLLSPNRSKFIGSKITVSRSENLFGRKSFHR